MSRKVSSYFEVTASKNGEKVTLPFIEYDVYAETVRNLRAIGFKIEGPSPDFTIYRDAKTAIETARRACRDR